MKNLLQGFLVSFLCLVFVLKVEAQTRQLEEWLEVKRSIRPALSDQEFSSESLNKKQAKKAVELLDRDQKFKMIQSYGEQWIGREIRYEEYKMPFFYKIWGEEPEDGRSLFLSMHGGGGAPASVNDKQYENQKKLYDATMKNMEGVYLAMRAPTDTWNLWHQAHIDEFINIIIQLAVIYENVNPNKVYILGYSAGGDGAFQLAPRLADRWAAASMMAGHPGDASALNLRNTPFAVQVGELDSAYKRNQHAAEWELILKNLHKQDSAGYKYMVKIPKGKGHWMQLEDAVALPWMQQFIRNPIPKKVVWRQDDVMHSRFYWLEVPESFMKKNGEIIAEFNTETNEINILENYSEELIIRLNDDMLNLDKPVTVKFKGNQIYRGTVQRNVRNVWNSLTYKGDANLAFSASLSIVNNQKVLNTKY
ncbi:hypothetical protein [Reichenbachiella sp. MALMAid0571]|uniref:hypothetical protein n=1 Tax=Reichenbachiella sp. MALMAid0571 TaxID=3143939 RepID=UPI0032DEEE2E